jgi:ribosomal protein L17
MFVRKIVTMAKNEDRPHRQSAKSASKDSECVSILVSAATLRSESIED